MPTNKHHILYPKPAYLHRMPHADLCTHPGMIHRIPIDVHDDLHAELPPPEKIMSAKLANIAIMTLCLVQHHERLEQFLDLQEYLEKISMGVGRIAVEAGVFAEWFDDQYCYIDRSVDN